MVFSNQKNLFDNFAKKYEKIFDIIFKKGAKYIKRIQLQ